MTQSVSIIWVCGKPEAIQNSVEQLEALTYHVTIHNDFDAVSAQSECEVFIVSHQKDNALAIDQSLKFKHEFSSGECLSIYITTEIELIDKENYFRLGGDYLIHEPFGNDELLAIINQNNIKKKIKASLRSQLDEASNMALMAMDNASDYGLILDFVKNAILAKSYKELSKNIFDCTNLFSSSCLLEFKTVKEYVYIYSSEYLDQDIKRILQVNKSQGRVVKIGDIVQINHENIVFLVEGLPVDDAEKMGRILDGLVTLCDVADRFTHSLSAEEKIHHSDESRRLFLTTLSHELKTPINSILGFSNVLLRKEKNTPLGDTGEDALNRIVDNTAAVNTIVNTLLEISSDNSDMNLDDKIEVDRIALRLNTKFSPQAKNKQLKFSIQHEPSLWFTSNEKVLNNMLDYLIDNAIKFTESGDVKVNIYSDEYSYTEKNVIFEVIDTGIGIDPVNHQRIFDEIGQLNKEHDRAHYGIGLGLYYVKQMSEQINATAQVESQLGQGATFTLKVCVEERENSDEPNQEGETDTTLF